MFGKGIFTALNCRKGTVSEFKLKFIKFVQFVSFSWAVKRFPTRKCFMLLVGNRKVGRNGPWGITAGAAVLSAGFNHVVARHKASH